MSTADYPDHILANVFPLLTDAAYVALVDDIQDNGLRDPIVLLDGAILDGRNRHRACIDAEVKPKFRTLTESDGDPLAFVISKNLIRRHLNESQRAMIAARLVGSAPRGGDRRSENFKPQNYGLNPYQAAVLLNVSPRSVETGKNVLAKGTPALIDDVTSGRLRLSAADKRVSRTADDSQEKDVKAAVSHASYITGLYQDILKRAKGDQERAIGMLVRKVMERPADFAAMFTWEDVHSHVKKYVETILESEHQ